MLILLSPKTNCVLLELFYLFVFLVFVFFGGSRVTCLFELHLFSFISIRMFDF